MTHKTTLSIFLFFIVAALVLLRPTPALAGVFMDSLDIAINWGWGTLGLSKLESQDLIISIINWILNLSLYLAALAIVIGGVMYILAWGDESRSSRAKNIIMYAVLGYAIVLGVYIINDEVRRIFGLTVKYIPISEIVIRVGNALLALGSVLAALAIIIGGYQYITSFGDEQKSSRGKQTITFALIGLLVAGMTSRLTTAVYNILTGAPAAGPFNNILLRLVQFALTPLAVIAVSALVYGGYTYITAAGDEQKTSTAKRTIIYAVIGIMIIMVSAAIVNIIVTITY